jgi:hypothetical protein
MKKKHKNYLLHVLLTPTNRLKAGPVVAGKHTERRDARPDTFERTVAAVEINFLSHACKYKQQQKRRKNTERQQVQPNHHIQP